MVRVMSEIERYDCEEDRSCEYEVKAVMQVNSTGYYVRHADHVVYLNEMRMDRDFERLRADTAEAEVAKLREQLRERDATIENLNDRHDLGVQERDRLRSQLSAEKALRLENQRITPARFKCLACGEYHEGSSNLPCPKMSPYAALNQKSEGESHVRISD